MYDNSIPRLAGWHEKPDSLETLVRRVARFWPRASPHFYPRSTHGQASEKQIHLRS
jgi:hypothetical protein